MEICGCSRSKNTLLSTFLFLDQIVWLGMTGIYKNKERVELLGRISLYCWLSSSVCTTLVELGELGRLSASMKKLKKELKDTDKYKNEQYRPKLGKSNDRSLALIKAGLDLVVAVGLLQLAPKKVTPRVTGAVGFTSSLMSCYQELKLRPCPVVFASFSGGPKACMYKVLQIIERSCEEQIYDEFQLVSGTVSRGSSLTPVQLISLVTWARSLFEDVESSSRGLLDCKWNCLQPRCLIP